MSLPTPLAARPQHAAVLSMSLCVGLLIAAEFLPVSLLTPIANDLHTSDGMAGQAISVSGLFAVLASLMVGKLTGRHDRKPVLLCLTVLLLLSVLLTALADSFAMLMLARAVLGLVIGGFWSLATATVSRLVAAEQLAAALGTLYMGNAVAGAFAAPVGSYLGGIIGWRGVFWVLVPLVLLNLYWQWRSLPELPAPPGQTAANPLTLLSLRHVRYALLAVMLTFGGAFSAFTYFRPFLEQLTRVSLPQLSLLLFGLGLAGFVGTRMASAMVVRHLYSLLGLLPLLLALLTGGLLLTGSLLWPVAMLLMSWGLVNAAIPVCWSAWMAQGVAGQAERTGGLMVAAIQLAILCGGALGGVLLDQWSIHATFLASVGLLLTAALLAGSGERLRPLST
ncbi:MFS transporter [Aquitalea sp. LB_tupeE]|uniref:MFS transporter n=1 Tax=Aquitalea sp. LB_tupeE TaxID=2748078 RepID=UPI0015BC47CA|nr:MFS transporter [Aquitalea sp. LB_tupeE]NWK80031.1 MFS transporter [Aquitalea sp. LB_tupeE]